MTLASSSVKYAVSKNSFRARRCRLVMAVAVRLAGVGPLGSVPPANCSIAAIWAGVGVGKPSGRGNSKGAATTPVAATAKASMVAGEVKCMMKEIAGDDFCGIAQVVEEGEKRDGK